MTRHALPLLALALAACGGDQKVGVYNAPPTVGITAPTDGSAVDEDTLVSFQAQVNDDQTDPPNLALRWSSDLQGILSETDPADIGGVALFATANLDVGNHTITLMVTDESGEQASDVISLTVNDVPDNPTIRIVHPVAGEAGAEGEAFEFVVSVADEQQAPETLLVSFESDLDGVFCEPTPDTIGVTACEQALTPGDHRLTFRVTDQDGLYAVEEYYFTVISASMIDDDGDGWTEVQGDCNDGDASVNPGAAEFYNDRDDDCDGLVDNGTVGYDDDGDGMSEIEGDCDDADPTAYNGAVETCDGVDDDCDTTVDETTECYDDDGDGYAETTGDCDDSYASSFPSAGELEDGRDNDCDGIVDEGTNAYDDDGDGWTENGGDCNDAVASIYPGASETCSGYDDDCDGETDERDASGCFTYYYDYDGDGYGSSSVSGRCLCAPDGYYDVANNTDCYDYNSGANPSATSYSSSSRGDGSYDWNCDGSQSKYYTDTGSCSWSLFSCSAADEGWDSTNPACGSSASWVYDCESCGFLWTSCCDITTSRTQICL